MSAFIVSEETINCVLTAFDPERRATRDDQNSLGLDLWRMNMDAVAQRYDEPAETVEAFWYRPSPFTSIQQFKAVQCLRYQCHEGNVPERALYHRLEGLMKRLACEIVCNLPAYNVAEWNLADREGWCVPTKD